MIADRIADEPELLERARARVEAWIAADPTAHLYAEAWRELLGGELPEIAAALVDPSERGRALRQSTPFAGAIDPRTRWRLWAEVRAQLEAS